MADVVRGNACILYIKLGSVYYPIACSKDVAISITRDLLELAPRASADAREYEYGRYTGKITGSGLTKVNTSPDNLYTVFDLIGYQLSKAKALVKYSVTDPSGNVKVFECNTLIEEAGVSKTSGQISGHSYSLQITGPINISTTPVENTNPQILIYEFTADGAYSTLTMTWGDNAEILVVYVNGVAKQVKTYPDSYTSGQVQYNPATKVITFGTALAFADYVKIIYVDVDTVVSAYTLEDGTGTYIEDGTGELILTA
jgi:hypothetical protein